METYRGPEPEKTPHPGGRPTSYTLDTAKEICDRVAHGESVRHICETEGMPARNTVFLWLGKHEEFMQLYARAKIAGCEAMVDDLTHIADDGTNDLCAGKDGKKFFDHEHINRSRLRVDTRKWYLSKIVPRLYGDRIALDHSGKIEVADRLRAARKRVGA